MTSAKSGSELIVEGLIEAGTEVIFGFPGGSVIPLYNVLYDAPIRHILTRHEQGAASAVRAPLGVGTRGRLVDMRRSE